MEKSFKSTKLIFEEAAETPIKEIIEQGDILNEIKKLKHSTTDITNMSTRKLSNQQHLHSHIRRTLAQFYTIHQTLNG